MSSYNSGDLTSSADTDVKVEGPDARTKARDSRRSEMSKIDYSDYPALLSKILDMTEQDLRTLTDFRDGIKTELKRVQESHSTQGTVESSDSLSQKLAGTDIDTNDDEDGKSSSSSRARDRSVLGREQDAKMFAEYRERGTSALLSLLEPISYLPALKRVLTHDVIEAGLSWQPSEGEDIIEFGSGEAESYHRQEACLEDMSADLKELEDCNPREVNRLGFELGRITLPHWLMNKIGIYDP